MQAAMRLSGLCGRAAGAQLPVQRLITGSRTLRALPAVCQLPHLGHLSQRASLATGRALPRATAVEAPTASTPASNGGPRAPAGVPTFQEAISRLQEYWAGVGCALWLPHNTEVRQTGLRRLGAVGR